MSLGVVMTVTAVAAVVGTVSSINAADAAKKQADKQYKSQQAAFADEVEGAITNAKWAFDDNKAAHYTDTTEAAAYRDNSVDQAYSLLAAKEEATNASALLKQLVNSETTDEQLTQLRDDTLSKLTQMREQAQLDADYAIAMGEYASDYYTTKAAIDAATKLETIQSTISLLDQDISSLRTEFAAAEQNIAIEGDEIMGKLIAQASMSLAGGNSVARQRASTELKLDRIKNENKLKYTSAIDKVTAQQAATAKQGMSDIQNIVKNANVLARREETTALTSAMRTLSSNKIDSKAKVKELTTTSDYLVGINNITNKEVAMTANIQNQRNASETATQVDKFYSDAMADQESRDAAYEREQKQLLRGMEQSIKTQDKTDKDKASKNRDILASSPEYDGFRDLLEGAYKKPADVAIVGGLVVPTENLSVLTENPSVLTENPSREIIWQ
jgi:hypothetical protein